MPAIVANSLQAKSSRLRPLQVRAKKYLARVILSTHAFPLGKVAVQRLFDWQNKR
jgi:hypothetical protein